MIRIEIPNVENEESPVSQSFLLRFAEDVPTNKEHRLPVGTETLTFIRSEQSDSDRGTTACRSIPNAADQGQATVTNNGTQTLTEVSREAVDKGSPEGTSRFIPREQL